MPTPKFSFVPERQVGGNGSTGHSYTVSLYANGSIIFPSEVVRVYELDGKYLRLYADVQKKSIGWSVIEDETSLEALNEARQIRKMKGGNAVVSVVKLLKHLGIPKGTKIMNLPVNVYKSPLNSSDIYYIELIVEKPYKKSEEEND